MTVNEHALQQISDYYGIPDLKFGMNVIVNRKAGKVSGISSSGLKAKLMNENKSICFHPTWETAYYDENWNVVKDFRKTTAK